MVQSVGGEREEGCLRGLGCSRGGGGVATWLLWVYIWPLYVGPSDLNNLCQASLLQVIQLSHLFVCIHPQYPGCKREDSYVNTNLVDR